MAKVRASLNIRFRGDDQPNIVFTDRGQGFYNIKGGRITAEYEEALRINGLTDFNKGNGSVQPGDLKDLMLHETAVSWITAQLTKMTPAKPWGETVDEFGERLRLAAEHINANFNVEGLCWELPQRLDALCAKQGDRLKK